MEKEAQIPFRWSENADFVGAQAKLRLSFKPMLGDDLAGCSFHS